MASQIQQNLIPNEPQLIDLLTQFKKEIFLYFSAHHIGTIQSFDATTQTASASINYKKTLFQFNSVTSAYETVLADYPTLTDCPVICLGGGGSSGGCLTFPIAVGDECLVLFNDRDMDNWFSGGSGSPNATARLHSFSDGLLLVGLRSMANVLSQYDSTRVSLRSTDGTTCVAVNPSTSKLLLTNTYPSNATTLNTLLQSLLSDLQNLISAVSTITVAITTAPGVSGPPNNAAAILAVGTALSSLGTQIGQLLE